MHKTSHKSGSSATAFLVCVCVFILMLFWFRVFFFFSLHRLQYLLGQFVFSINYREATKQQKKYICMQYAHIRRFFLFSPLWLKLIFHFNFAIWNAKDARYWNRSGSMSCAQAIQLCCLCSSIDWCKSICPTGTNIHKWLTMSAQDNNKNDPNDFVFCFCIWCMYSLAIRWFNRRFVNETL